MLAAMNGHEDCIRRLHEWKAKLEPKQKSGRTALIMASLNGHDLCVKRLIEFRAHVNVYDESGWSPAILATLGGKINCLKILVDARASLDAKDNRGRTAVMKAAANGDVDCLKLLKEAGADMDIRDEESTTAVMKAAQLGLEGCMRFLILSQVDLNASTKADGRTALHMYENSRGLEAAKSLLPHVDWHAAAGSGEHGLSKALREAFPPQGSRDPRCQSSLSLELWMLEGSGDGSGLKTRDARLAEDLVVIIEKLLVASQKMTIDQEGKELLLMLLRAGVISALQEKRQAAVLHLTTQVLSTLEQAVEKRQEALVDVGSLTGEPNEYHPHLDRLGSEVSDEIDQRDAIPKVVWRWIEAQPLDADARLRCAFEAFQLVGVAPTTDAFRDFLITTGLIADDKFHSEVAAHLLVSYGKLVDPFFQAFMKRIFGDRVVAGPLKQVSRVLAKIEADRPELKDRNASDDVETRCATFQICDIVRCTIMCEHAEDMISVVKCLKSPPSASQTANAATGMLEVWRIKNTHHHGVDIATLVGGYRDVKIIGRYTFPSSDKQALPISMLVEVQVLDKVFADVKKYMHRPYSINRGDFTSNFQKPSAEDAHSRLKKLRASGSCSTRNLQSPQPRTATPNSHAKLVHSASYPPHGAR
jgi:ankyrin repeat protein